MLLLKFVYQRTTLSFPSASFQLNTISLCLPFLWFGGYPNIILSSLVFLYIFLHIHTHTHIYIYIYILLKLSVFRVEKKVYFPNMPSNFTSPHVDFASFPASMAVQLVAARLQQLAITNQLNSIPEVVTRFTARQMPSVTILEYLDRILKVYHNMILLCFFLLFFLILSIPSS